jgi:hypothetical protein
VPAQPLLFALFALTAPAPGLLVARLIGATPALGRGAGALLGLLISLAATSLLALACALAGVFSLPLVLALNVALAFAVAALGWRRLRAPAAGAAPPPRSRDLGRLALLPGLALAAFLYFQPSEYFFGGWDPGVYLNTGANLARTGAITIHDPTLAALPADTRELFLQQRRGLRAKYPGFLVRDAAAGELQPTFNHLYPVWIALFVAGLGPAGGLWVGPLFCMLSVATLSLLGAALFDTATGLVAAAVLGFSIPLIWQAGFPTSEPLSLCFSLAGWLCAALCIRHGDRRLAGVAAVFFGSALLAKITTLPPLLLLAGTGLLAGSSPAARERRALSAGLALVVVATAPYFLVAAREYTADVFGGALSLRVGASGAALGLAAAAAVAGAWLLARTLSRFAGAYRAAAGALLAGAGLYGYFLRPAVEHSRDAGNLVQLGWFVTPLALLLALAGVLLVLFRPAAGRLGEAQTVFLAVAAASAAVLLHHKQIAPFYLWALRRYVPELLPALALFVAVAVVAVAGRGSRLRAAVAAVLLAAVVGLGLYRGRHLLGHRDYPGAFAQIARVAAAIPAGAVTVCMEGWLATPLQYQFGKPTLAVADITPDKARRVADTLAAWAGAGREVYLAADGGAFFTRRFGLEPAAVVAFDLPVLERTAARYPRAVQRFAPRVALSRVVPFTAASAPRTDRVDVGLASFGLERGFFPPERAGGGEAGKTFRWTAAEAALDLPEPSRWGDARELVLTLGSGRPPGMPDPRVEVLVDGVGVAALRVGPRLQPYRVPVPAGVVPANGRGYVELTVRAETFVPSAAGGSRDARSLGVMWESVSVR